MIVMRKQVELEMLASGSACHRYIILIDEWEKSFSGVF